MTGDASVYYSVGHHPPSPFSAKNVSDRGMKISGKYTRLTVLGVYRVGFQLPPLSAVEYSTLLGEMCRKRYMSFRIMHILLKSTHF